MAVASISRRTGRFRPPCRHKDTTMTLFHPPNPQSERARRAYALTLACDCTKIAIQYHRDGIAGACADYYLQAIKHLRAARG